MRRKYSLSTYDTNKKFGTGFTLIEIVLSVLLITIIAAGVLVAFTETYHFFNRARHRLQASNFAREALDRLRGNYNYSSTPQMTVGTAKPEVNIGSIIRGEMKDITALSTTLTYDVSAEPETGSYKQVKVYVTWNEAGF